MTDRDHRLSLSRQAELLGISRGSLYYEPRPPCTEDLKLMRRIDVLHMEYPFAGSRMMKGLLRQEGFPAGRLHVATLMKTMGIEALYRRPNTSKPAPGHKVYPYLLRKLAARMRHAPVDATMERPGRGIGSIRPHHRRLVFSIEQQKLACLDTREMTAPRVHQELRSRFIDGETEMVGDRFVHIEAGRPAEGADKSDPLFFEVHAGPIDNGGLGRGHAILSLFETQALYRSGPLACLSIMPARNIRGRFGTCQRL